VDSRIKALRSLNPRAVALPNGTDITTRVAKSLGDRVIPQGARGRIVATSELQVDVLFVGVGRLSYERNEVLPTKREQVRYAERRGCDWAALMPNVLLSTVVGSRAWGLADEDSDTDVRGVFGLPLSWSTGLLDAPRDLVSADGSSTYWELSKSIRQALRADPNTLEMLFVPTAHAHDEVGEWLLAAREAFVSREIYGSFGRYALAQLNRFAQSTKLAELRTHMLEWLQADPALSLDAAAERLAQQDSRLSATSADRVHQAKEHIKQLCRSLHDQGLVAVSDYPALVAFAATRDASVSAASDLRPKNAYNLLRLMHTAINWLATGYPEFEMRGAFRDKLLAIKRGQVPLREIMRHADTLGHELERAHAATRLPARANVAVIDAVLRRSQLELAARFVGRMPGPFGLTAVEPPAIAWDEIG
jgi:RNA repair pathway DNA polymerase beta family